MRQMIVAGNDPENDCCSFCGKGKAEGLHGLTKSLDDSAFICVSCATRIGAMMKAADEEFKAIIESLGDSEPPVPTGEPDCPCIGCQMNRRMKVRQEQFEAVDTTGQSVH